MSSITLCLIARDEERMLPDCLASVRGVVDRIVVVDTGSTDRTREIARAAGATVVEHPWSDDFAAARNAALAHVPGGWLLVLDADERLAAGAGKALRKAVARGGFDCGMLPLSNASALDAAPADVLSGKARRGEPVLLPRLLRRTDDLRWEGIVHESVGAWVERGKRRVARVEAPIVHYGAVPDVRAARAKDERNLRLLERRVELAPDDVVARTYLVREIERTGDRARAEDEADRAWAALLEQRARGSQVDVVQLATLRAFFCLRSRRNDDARATLSAARGNAGVHPNLDLLAGVLEERCALAVRDEGELAAALARAEACYRACLAAHGALYFSELMPGATDWAAATRLGTVLLLQGRATDALAAFERALSRAPGNTEARLGRAEALNLSGRAKEALTALEPLLAEPGADAWLLSGLALLQLGLHDDAARCTLEAGRRRHAVELVAAHRGDLLRELAALFQSAAPAPLPGARAGQPTV